LRIISTLLDPSTVRLRSELNMSDSHHRARAEEEVGVDLRKDLRQLLVDVHDELLRSDRGADENILHAQKRLASLQVRVAQSTDRQSRIMLSLTWIIVLLTIVLVVLTVVMLWKMP
jgi:hypothetical protein